ISRASEEAAVGIERQRINNVVAGTPQLFGSTVDRKAINAAGKLLRKRNERRLALRLSAKNDSASSDRGALRRGDNRGRRGSGRVLFLADGCGVHGPVLSNGNSGHFALGGFIKNET